MTAANFFFIIAGVIVTLLIGDAVIWTANRLRDTSEWPMRDIWIRGACLRVFYRGWRKPMPYFFRRWGFYGFGALSVGFMFWPQKAPYLTWWRNRREE